MAGGALQRTQSCAGGAAAAGTQRRGECSDDDGESVKRAHWGARRRRGRLEWVSRTTWRSPRLPWRCAERVVRARSASEAVLKLTLVHTAAHRSDGASRRLELPSATVGPSQSLRRLVPCSRALARPPRRLASSRSPLPRTRRPEWRTGHTEGAMALRTTARAPRGTSTRRSDRLLPSHPLLPLLRTLRTARTRPTPPGSSPLSLECTAHNPSSTSLSPS